MMRGGTRTQRVGERRRRRAPRKHYSNVRGAIKIFFNISRARTFSFLALSESESLSLSMTLSLSLCPCPCIPFRCPKKPPIQNLPVPAPPFFPQEKLLELRKFASVCLRSARRVGLGFWVSGFWRGLGSARERSSIMRERATKNNNNNNNNEKLYVSAQSGKKKKLPKKGRAGMAQHRASHVFETKLQNRRSSAGCGLRAWSWKLGLHCTLTRCLVPAPFPCPSPLFAPKESCNYENFINSADFLALRKPSTARSEGRHQVWVLHRNKFVYRPAFQCFI